MPAGGLVTAGIGGAIGLGTTIYGMIQKNKAEKAAKANVMPQYDIQPEEQYNLDIARSQAGQGMSDASRAAYMNNAGSGLAATTNAILRGGGDANSIGNAYNKYDTGISSQAIYDDQARMQHLSNLQGAYTRMSAQKDKQWQINKYQPWANKAQALAQQLAGSQNMITSGINTMGTAAIQGASGYFNRTKPIPTTGQRPPGEGIQPLNTNQNNTWQPQSFQNPDQPQFPSNYGGGWNAPMAASEPGAFSFPSYYGMDYKE